jgi:hypothetical protein
MENQTRYDLNAAVENWRNELAAQPNLASNDRRELETHLRDAIAGFQQRGLNDEESFWLARRRVGQPPQLGDEFVKANPSAVWRERVFWMALACLAISLWATAINDLYSFQLIRFSHFSSTPPAWILWLRSIAFREFVFTLPILLIAISLVRNQMNINHRLKRSFICSRLCFCFLAAVITLMVHYFNINSMLSDMRTLKITTTTAMIPDLLSQCLWPLMLVGLTTWLMPTQNRKTPKRA